MFFQWECPQRFFRAHRIDTTDIACSFSVECLTAVLSPYFPPTFYEKIIPYIYELTMTKGGKAIKYMVKNAKARKILKKVKKMRKKRDVCACVGVRVADNKISGSEQ